MTELNQFTTKTGSYDTITPHRKNKAVWQEIKSYMINLNEYSGLIVHSIVKCLRRSDTIDYLIRPLGVQYNKGCLEMWPSQIAEDSPRFMSQLRASVASPDRRIILWFKLGKYWSCCPQWQASRPEIEGNGLLGRVKKEDRCRKEKYAILPTKLDNTLRGNLDINSQSPYFQVLHSCLLVKDSLIGLKIHGLNTNSGHPSKQSFFSFYWH